jgi:broad specificity phosphatase PhoE
MKFFQKNYLGGIFLRLYIIRHADPDYLNNTITPEGCLEAKALANRLSKEGLDRIYCSPMGRAIHTMQYTAEALKLKAKILEWTQELESLKIIKKVPWPIEYPWDIPGEMLLNKKPLSLRADGHALFDELQGLNVEEKFREIIQYSDEFFNRLGFERQGTKYKILFPSNEKVAVFCHGGFGLTWLAHLLNIPLTTMWSSFWLSPSSVTTILFEQRSANWAVPRCIGLGDTSHLYESDLEIKPSGIKANFE